MLTCARSSPQSGRSYLNFGRAVKAGSFAGNAVFVHELAGSRNEGSACVIPACHKRKAHAEAIAALLL